MALGSVSCFYVDVEDEASLLDLDLDLISISNGMSTVLL